MDGRPNRRNKAAFSNSSGVAWTGSSIRQQRLSLTLTFVYCCIVTKTALYSIFVKEPIGLIFDVYFSLQLNISFQLSRDLKVLKSTTSPAKPLSVHNTSKFRTV